MANTIEIDDLDKAVADVLKQYSEQAVLGVREAVKEAIDVVDDETRKSIKFRQRTGKYVRNFDKKVEDTATGAQGVWFVNAPDYRLTHLLEKGHKTRKKSGKYGNKDTTKKYPHIKYGAKKGKEIFKKRIEEVLKNGGD